MRLVCCLAWPTCHNSISLWHSPRATDRPSKIARRSLNGHQEGKARLLQRRCQTCNSIGYRSSRCTLIRQAVTCITHYFLQTRKSHRLVHKQAVAVVVDIVLLNERCKLVGLLSIVERVDIQHLVARPTNVLAAVAHEVQLVLTWAGPGISPSLPLP